jgi:hypothetical protein
MDHSIKSTRIGSSKHQNHPGLLNQKKEGGPHRGRVVDDDGVRQIAAECRHVFHEEGQPGLGVGGNAQTRVPEQAMLKNGAVWVQDVQQRPSVALHACMQNKSSRVICPPGVVPQY